MPQPQNTMTKQYILDRIAARKASLTSTITTNQKIVDDWWYQADASIVKTLEARINKLETYVVMGKAAVKGVEKAKTVREKWKAVSEFQISQYGAGWPDLIGLPQADRASYSGTDPVNIAMHKLESAKKELSLLEHAEAYLKESPMNDYSITALSKLGLIEAVKFSVPTPGKS